MNNQPHFATSPFDAIRKTDEQGNEYLSARELSKLLGYTQYNKFENVIRKAEKACEESKQAVSDHIAQTHNMIQTDKSGQREVKDFIYRVIVQDGSAEARPDCNIETI